jgi:E2F/DP family winged-helix DNA-binding domain
VYDALNVLMAMDIIRKDKKEIAWLGLPNDVLQELDAAEREKALLESRIFQKRKLLQDLIAKVRLT